MSKTWYVVLSKSCMKIFSREVRTEPLQHVKTVQNELVDVPPAQLRRHQPGTKSKGARGGFGVSREVMNNGENPADLAVEQFAREIAHYLDQERRQNHVRELKIAADPKFMGLLRKNLPKETLGMVRIWLTKDLEKADVEELNVAFARATAV
jgi:protein required for attachment to host cells